MQAARGTSVAKADGPDSGQIRRTRWLLFAATAVVWYAADQITKHLAVTRLADGEPRHLVGSLLKLQLARNPGAAFSLGTGSTVALTCLAILATFVVLWVARKAADPIWALALGLLLAGIDGNLTDRLLRDPGAFHGHVVDFLELPHWPIFNVADMGINIGAALVLLQIVRSIRMDGTRASEGDE